MAKPSSAVEGAATRWYLNAGTFSQKANATSLQENLKKQGFAASIKEVVSQKGTVYKVRVGPMLDKAKAQAVKSKLAQINVNSFVSGDE
jgi:DedD protein